MHKPLEIRQETLLEDGKEVNTSKTLKIIYYKN